MNMQEISYPEAMNLPRVPSSLERAPCPSKDNTSLNMIMWCHCRAWRKECYHSPCTAVEFQAAHKPAPSLPLSSDFAQ